MKVDKTQKMNHIDFNNKDPMLSQFKHHFFLRKVYMPRYIGMEDFRSQIYKGFKVDYLNEHSIYIVQMVNVYQKQTVDLVIGFRRDQIAFRIARDCKVFYSLGKQAQIQFCHGFKLYFQSLSKKEEELLDDKSKVQNKVPQIVQKEKKSRSRSRSVEVKKKKDLKDRLQSPIRELQQNIYTLRFLMVPMELNRNIITSHFQKLVSNGDIVMANWKKDQDNYDQFQISIKDQKAAKLMFEEGVRIDGYELLITEKTGRAKQINKQHQIKAIKAGKISNQQLDVEQIEKILMESKLFVQNKLKIINILRKQENQYWITMSKIIKLQEKIKLEDWTFEKSNNGYVIDRPSTRDHYWYSFIKKKYQNKK